MFRVATRLLPVLPFLSLAVRPSEAVLLRYKFQPGETLTYTARVTATGQMTSSIQPTPQPVSVSGVFSLTYKILAVNPDGSYTIRIALQPKAFNISIGGIQQPQPLLRPMTFQVVLTPLGELKKIQLEAQQGQVPGAIAPGMEGMLDPSQFVTQVAGSIQFPVEDVQVGQTWTGMVKISSPLLQRPLQLTTKSKLVQLTTYMGRPCAVIDTSYEMPLNFSLPAMGITSSGRHTGTTRTHFDYQGGRTVCSKGNFQIALTAQAQFPQPDGTTTTFSMMFQMTGDFEETLTEGA